MLQGLRDRFFGQSLLSRVLLLTSSTIVAQLLVILAMPIISRLFPPAELGQVALVTVFINAIQTVICLRYNSALPLAERPMDAARMVWVSLAGGIVGSLFFYGIFLILLKAEWLGFDILPDWSHWIILICMPGLIGFTLGQSWWLRRRNAGMVGASLIARAGAQNGTRIAAGAAGAGLPGLMLAEIAMTWSSVYMLIKMPWRRIRGGLKSARRLWQQACRWWRFPLIEGPSAALNSLAVFLPVPLAAALYGAEVAGWFMIAFRVGSIPIGQIGRALSHATYMDFAEAIRQQDPVRARRLFYRVIKRLALLAVIPMGLFAALGPVLAGPVLGSGWAESGVFLALMVPWLYAQLVISPVSRLMSVLQRQDLKLIFDAAALVAIFLAWLGATVLDLAPRDFILLLSGLLAVAYGVYFFVIRYALNSYIEARTPDAV
ncbi:MAG: oligosaccharide flippase family protein [Pseudomonadota bacterium]